MLAKLKYAVAAVALSLAPVSASALTFYSVPGYVVGGGTYEIGSGLQKVNALSVNGEAAGSFTITVANNLASLARFSFDFGSLFFNTTFPSYTIAYDGTIVTAPFTTSLAGGESKDIVVSYGTLGAGDRFAATLSSVPVPAAGLLLLGALGAAGALRRRKPAKTAATV